MSLRPAYRRQPVWLATPGRWSDLGIVRACATLAIIAVLLMVALAASRSIVGVSVDGSPGLELIGAVRHGGDYYAVLAAWVQGAGIAASGWTTPLPTLFLIEGGMPGWTASIAMMLLATAAILAWYARFGGLLTTRAARVIALLLMLAGVAVALRLPLVAMPEDWAGLLVALSLARRAPGWSIEATALGLAAATLSCAALPYAVVMALTAARERAWREGSAWGLVVAVGVMIVLLHGHAVALSLSSDAAQPGSRALAPGVVLAALGSATGFGLMPVGIASLLVALATIGWASRREAVALRVASLILAHALWIALLDSPNAALVVAPLLPLGLIAAPGAIRDLAAAAIDRRRITVTRLGREGLVR